MWLNALVIETAGLRKTLRRASRRCAGLDPAGARGDRSAGSSAATAPARPRRSRCCSAWRGQRAGRRACSACRPTSQQASVEIRRRTGFVSDDKDLYDYMTVERDDPLHRAVLPALARRSRAALPATIRAAARAQGQGAVARHAHEAGAAAGALPRRRAADPRRADRPASIRRRPKKCCRRSWRTSPAKR